MESSGKTEQTDAPFSLSAWRAPYLEKAAKFREEYYRAHSACPKCGSRRLHSHLVGYTLRVEHMEDYKDLNQTVCTDCEWTGVVHDRVPAVEKPKE